jgi:hypothetical protein
MSDVITIKILRKGIKSLRKSQYPQIPFWVDNKYFYLNDICKFMFGENPTLKELKKAEKSKSGYIKTLRGYKLYITKNLEADIIPIIIKPL